VMELSQRQETAARNSRRQQEDREFSSHFRQNNTLVGNTLSAEDRREVIGACSTSLQQRVKQLRRDSLEQVRQLERSMEKRRNRLAEEGKKRKRNLSEKTLEVGNACVVHIRWVGSHPLWFIGGVKKYCCQLDI